MGGGVQKTSMRYKISNDVNLIMSATGGVAAIARSVCLMDWLEGRALDKTTV